MLRECTDFDYEDDDEDDMSKACILKSLLTLINYHKSAMKPIEILEDLFFIERGYLIANQFPE